MKINFIENFENMYILYVNFIKNLKIMYIMQTKHCKTQCSPKHVILERHTFLRFLIK